MQIEPNVYLVGSGRAGFDLTDPFDCNVYLFDSGDGVVLFDAGTGMATYDFDALLPGHLTFSLRDGKRHVEAACAIIAQMGCPLSILQILPASE